MTLCQNVVAMMVINTEVWLELDPNFIKINILSEFEEDSAKTVTASAK